MSLVPADGVGTRGRSVLAGSGRPVGSGGARPTAPSSSSWARPRGHRTSTCTPSVPMTPVFEPSVPVRLVTRRCSSGSRTCRRMGRRSGSPRGAPTTPASAMRGHTCVISTLARTASTRSTPTPRFSPDGSQVVGEAAAQLMTGPADGSAPAREIGPSSCAERLRGRRPDEPTGLRFLTGRLEGRPDRWEPSGDVDHRRRHGQGRADDGGSPELPELAAARSLTTPR